MSSIIIVAGLLEFSSIPVFNIDIGQSANVITISYVLRQLIEMSYQLWVMILDV